MERTTKAKMASCSLCITDVLPAEVMAQVVATVGRSSICDLFNLTSASKILYELRDEDQVMKDVNLEDFTYGRWGVNPQKEEFLVKCLEKGSPDAMFIVGFTKVFARIEKTSCLQLLYKGALQGNRPAYYLFALLLLCVDVERLRDKGKEILSTFSVSELFYCRQRVSRLTKGCFNRVTLRVGNANTGVHCTCGQSNSISQWDGGPIGCECNWFFPELLYVLREIN